MGYIFILFAVIANAAKGASSKFVSGNISTVGQNLTFNGVRNLLSTLIAFVTVFIAEGTFVFSLEPVETIICCISGAAMAVFVVSWTFAMRSGAYMLVSGCNSASFIIPCAFGCFILKEKISFFEFLAFIIIIVALCFLLRYNLTLNSKLKVKDSILLVLVFLSTGINQAMQKTYAVNFQDKNVAYYIFYTFTASTLLLFLVSLFFKSRDTSSNRPILAANFKYLVAMAFGNFLATYFQGVAAKSVDAIILYPLLNVLSLIAGSVMSALLFKEKITKNCIIGVVLVGFALILSRF